MRFIVGACMGRHFFRKIMSRDEYTPNERICARAAELWAHALISPVFNNGDTSRAGGMSAALATLSPNNSSDAVLTAFRTELTAILMAKWTTPPYRPDGAPYIAWINNLECDYDPGAPLVEAARRANLKTKFPWKTRMWIQDDHLSFSQGYGAQNVYHYPACDGHWVVTSLHGSIRDEEWLVRFAEAGGRAPFFTVDALDHQPIQPIK